MRSPPHPETGRLAARRHADTLWWAVRFRRDGIIPHTAVFNFADGVWAMEEIDGAVASYVTIGTTAESGVAVFTVETDPANRDNRHSLNAWHRSAVSSGWTRHTVARSGLRSMRDPSLRDLACFTIQQILCATGACGTDPLVHQHLTYAIGGSGCQSYPDELDGAALRNPGPAAIVSRNSQTQQRPVLRIFALSENVEPTLAGEMQNPFVAHFATTVMGTDSISLCGPS